MINKFGIYFKRSIKRIIKNYLNDQVLMNIRTKFKSIKFKIGFSWLKIRNIFRVCLNRNSRDITRTIFANYLNDQGLFEIPSHIKSVRFDIGLSWCAPNSGLWLKNDNSIFVIGVEANKYAAESIIQNGFIIQQENNLQIPFNSQLKNYALLNVALDNVDDQTKKRFYHMKGDVGVSSLLKPTEALGYEVLELDYVDVLPLSMLMDKIDWNRFEYIELVKIDTQGKDLDIIKSAKNYLDKIVFLNCEINTFNHYENNVSPDEYHTYLESMGFEKVIDNSVVNGEVVDVTYINKKYLHLKDKINYSVL
jgi:hypothetical protein